MCQCGFTGNNKGATLEGTLTRGRLCACRAEGMRKISDFLLHFAVHIELL